MSSGCVLCASLFDACLCVSLREKYIHIGVGSARCSFNGEGHARASRVGRVTTVSRFFCVITLLRSQSVMGTLINVASQTEDPQGMLPCEGLPPLTAAGAENMATGVSLEYILQPDRPLPEGYSWYVLRVTYGRELEAESLLTGSGLLTYVPKRKTLREVDGKKKKVEESLLHNLLFVYVDAATVRSLVATPLKTNSPRKDKAPLQLHFMYDRTRQNDRGRNDIITIPHREMVNFIRFTVSGSESIRAVTPADFRIKRDQRVMITDGEFKGVVGRVARVGRQTCVLVDLHPVCFLASAYIPKAFLREVGE